MHCFSLLFFFFYFFFLIFFSFSLSVYLFLDFYVLTSPFYGAADARVSQAWYGHPCRTVAGGRICGMKQRRLCTKGFKQHAENMQRTSNKTLGKGNRSLIVYSILERGTKAIVSLNPESSIERDSRVSPGDAGCHPWCTKYLCTLPETNDIKTFWI